ncbi:FAD binding domain-containing protein [Ferrovibrio xuzhouensis]|uniref:FAD binding domain-containing protein n=1 Tax=Ferrovibrio xuzhouensis TaxID=1576914 RepID=A0ABV7VCM4_9PROT
MKAADFDYVCPASLDEVCQQLKAAAGDAKVLAGGQTLVPLLAMRLTRPALLVDINNVAELRGIREDDDALVIGGATRQAMAEHSALVHRALPLLIKGLRNVGHIQTRNRGTVGGSVANADPSSEICLVSLTLSAEITCRGPDGDRAVPAEEFFLGPMVTALEPDECLTEIRIPVWRDEGGAGCGFQEISPRRSDFALASAAAQLVMGADGICRRAAAGIGGAGATPMRVDEAADLLVGTAVEDADIARAVEAAISTVEAETDLHATADYRRRVAGVMLERAIREARAQALGTKVQ